MRIEVDIPAAVSGDYENAHYTDATTDRRWQSYLSIKNDTDQAHTVLIKDSCPMPIMQDSEAEYNEHQWLFDNATGDVLVGGLGLGLLHGPLMDNPDVTSVTIIEISQDVVDLVWEHCEKDETFSLIMADFETWVPPEGTTFDIVWGDSWIFDNPMSIGAYNTLISDRYSPYANDVTTFKVGFWGDLP